MISNRVIAVAPVVSILKKRIAIVVLLVAFVWVFEIVIARGAYVQIIENHKNAALWSALLFCIGILLATSSPLLRPMRDFGSRREAATQTQIFMIRGVLIVTLLIVLFLWSSGWLDYARVIRSESGIGLFALWAPVLIGVVLLLFYHEQKMGLTSKFLVVAAIIISSLPGGRTVPAVLCLFVLIRYFFLNETLVKIKPRWLFLGVVSAFIVIWVLAAIGATREDGLDRNVWQEDSLALFGYSSVLPGGANVLANLGVIGESATIMQAVFPEILPYAGPTLLFTDLFSFVPMFSATLDGLSIEAWGFFGAPVETSRPGGLYTSFFMVGGNWFVLLGAAIYGIILRRLLFNARAGSATQYAIFMVFMAAFLVGAYGNGWPTGMLFASIFVFTFFNVLLILGTKANRQNAVRVK